MIIKFKYGDYDEICEDNQELFDYAEPQQTEEQDGSILVVRGPRIVIPKLKASFREADWYVRNPLVEDEDDEDAWTHQCSVGVCYEIDEKDINKYISYTSNFEYGIMDACGEAGVPMEEKNDLECYNDTEEFMSGDGK